MDDIRFQLGGRDGEVLIVTVPRDLGHEAADPLRETVVRHLPNRDGVGVVLDMSHVAMISSIGIASLLQIAEACKDRKATLILAAVPDRQLAFFKMLRLDRKFPFAPTIDEAVGLCG